MKIIVILSIGFVDERGSKKDNKSFILSKIKMDKRWWCYQLLQMW